MKTSILFLLFSISFNTHAEEAKQCPIRIETYHSKYDSVLNKKGYLGSSYSSMSPGPYHLLTEIYYHCAKTKNGKDEEVVKSPVRYAGQDCRGYGYESIELVIRSAKNGSILLNLSTPRYSRTTKNADYGLEADAAYLWGEIPWDHFLHAPKLIREKTLKHKRSKYILKTLEQQLPNCSKLMETW